MSRRSLPVEGGADLGAGVAKIADRPASDGGRSARPVTIGAMEDLASPHAFAHLVQLHEKHLGKVLPATPRVSAEMTDHGWGRVTFYVMVRYNVEDEEIFLQPQVVHTIVAKAVWPTPFVNNPALVLQKIEVGVPLLQTILNGCLAESEQNVLVIDRPPMPRSMNFGPSPSLREALTAVQWAARGFLHTAGFQTTCRDALHFSWH